MSSEAEWVGSLVERLSTSLQVGRPKDRTVVVANGKRLAYSHEIHAYKIDDPARRQFAAYQTDLLVFDRVANEEWIPRVVVECKLGNITTHDALTYSTKASTHKQVHPYLRYGILIGLRKGYGIPGYLFVARCVLRLHGDLGG